jgi:hypothetical protein
VVEVGGGGGRAGWRLGFRVVGWGWAGGQWGSGRRRGHRRPGWWCRMDLPGPTASVGTRTDYSVGPWDYSACATRHLMAWVQGLRWRSTQIGSYACPVLCRELLAVPD